MRCRGLHRLANPAYLSRFLFCDLPCVAPYCVPSGVRVVSKLVTHKFSIHAGERSAEEVLKPSLSCPQSRAGHLK
jgi:hypothetical protein